MTLTTDTCPQCGKEFNYYPSSYGHGRKLYCSRACRSAATRITTTCPQCGKEFWYHQSWPRKYCSRTCSAAVNAKTNLGIQELPPQTCEVCNTEITGARWAGQRFCSRKCFGIHLKMTLAGVPRPNVAGERPDLQKRVTLECPQCHKPFRVKHSHATRRRFCSRSCMAAFQRTLTGPQASNWQGGYDPYYGPNWRAQRRNARRRDGYICQRCGITEDQLGRQLDVHHITPFRTFGPQRYREANRLANLISLCPICHLRVEHENGTRPNPPRLL